MTTPQAQRQIGTLRVTADSYLVTKKRSSIDAKTLTELVQSSCLAITSSSSPKLDQFVHLCRRALHYEVNQPGTPPSFAEVEAILMELFPLIDELFFFRILTRRVYVDAKQKKTRQLVDLKLLRERRNRAQGVYQHHPKVRIKIWLIKAYGDSVPLSRLLLALLHEACHAFFAILADDKHPGHRKWVKAHRAHGEMFVVLNTFVMQCVTDLVPSEVLRNLRIEELRFFRTRGWSQ
ncbi:hypothetical protein F5Y08DRAFT_353135 [Xylaria arbuscula]|nr:hypothetical protein F5Y08DRAFT_353135 [Xylaria arbuscula]